MGSNDNHIQPGGSTNSKSFLLSVERVRKIIQAVKAANVDGMIYVQPSPLNKYFVYTREQVETMGGQMPLACRVTTPGRLLAHYLVTAVQEELTPQSIQEHRATRMVANHRQLRTGVMPVPRHYVYELLKRFGHQDTGLSQEMIELFEPAPDIHRRFNEFVACQRRIEKMTQDHMRELRVNLAQKEDSGIDVPVAKEVVGRVVAPLRLRRDTSEITPWDEATLAAELGKTVAAVQSCATALGLNEKKWTMLLPVIQRGTWRNLTNIEPDKIAETCLHTAPALERYHDMMASVQRVLRVAQKNLPNPEELDPKTSEDLAKIDAVYQQLHHLVGSLIFNGQTSGLLKNRPTPDSWSRG